MPMTDEQLLDGARKDIGRGDDFYLRAGKKMATLLERGWTIAAVARGVGKSRQWVRQVVDAARKWQPDATGNVQVAWERGSHATTAEIAEGAKRVLTDPAQRDQLFAELDATEIASLARAISAWLEPEAPREIVGAGPERYEIDKFIARVARAMHEARQRVDTFDLRSLRPLAELRDALNQIADDVAVVTAAVHAALEEEKDHEAAA